MLLNRGSALAALLIAQVAALPAGLFAQSFLFVSSEPMGAKAYLDGVLQARRTPMLLRGLAEGRHAIRLEKEGYIAREAEVELPKDGELELELSPEEIRIHFDGEPGLRFAGKEERPADGSIGLKEGALSLRPKAEGIELAPIFGEQALLDGIRFSLPLFLGLSGALTAREIVWPRESPFVIAPELAISGLVSAGLLAWDIALEIKKKKFLEGYEPRMEGPESLELSARYCFDRASETMVRGDFKAALEQFEALRRDFPESGLAAQALFEGARLRYLLGDREGAAAAFRAVVEDYPLPELYDRAAKALADTLLAAGDAEGARRSLDLLTYYGGYFSRGEIEASLREATGSGPRSP